MAGSNDVRHDDNAQGGVSQRTAGFVDEASSALAESMAGLSQLAAGHGQQGLADMLTHVAQFAVEAIPGAEGAGLTLQEQGRSDTIVSTAPFVNAVDDVQYKLGEGPCISAAAVGRTMRSAELARDPRWPRFGPRIASLGVHSVLSLPLLVGARVLGAMNVYAHKPAAFDDRAQIIGQRYALPAATAVQHAQALFQAQRMASELQAAMATRAVIDQAIGIVMSRAGCSPQEAFDRLRVISQAENKKLSDVGERLVNEAVRRARAQHRGRGRSS